MLNTNKVSNPTFAGNQPDSRDWGYVLAVVDRGFVYVGRAVTEGNWLHMTGVQGVTKFGWDAIGQLYDGPHRETELAPNGDIVVPLTSVLSLMFVDEKKWVK